MIKVIPEKSIKIKKKITTKKATKKTTRKPPKKTTEEITRIPQPTPEQKKMIEETKRRLMTPIKGPVISAVGRTYKIKTGDPNNPIRYLTVPDRKDLPGFIQNHKQFQSKIEIKKSIAWLLAEEKRELRRISKKKKVKKK